jgi:hypothetical protein
MKEVCVQIIVTAAMMEVLLLSKSYRPPEVRLCAHSTYLFNPNSIILIFHRQNLERFFLNFIALVVL